MAGPGREIGREARLLNCLRSERRFLGFFIPIDPVEQVLATALHLWFCKGFRGYQGSTRCGGMVRNRFPSVLGRWRSNWQSNWRLTKRYNYMSDQFSTSKRYADVDCSYESSVFLMQPVIVNHSISTTFQSGRCDYTLSTNVLSPLHKYPQSPSQQKILTSQSGGIYTIAADNIPSINPSAAAPGLGTGEKLNYQVR